MVLAVLALLFGATARAAADDVLSFKSRGDNEKEFVTEVGTVIVRAARTAPSKIKLQEYGFEEVKDRKDRKVLKITMTWEGAVSKKITSTIVVKIDTSSEKEWQVLSIDYKDDNKVSPFKPNFAKIRDLIKKFNR